MIAETIEAYPDREAIEWGLRYVPGGRVEQVSAMPWATLYVLRNDQEAAYLKILPAQAATAVAAAAAIAGLFPDQVPEVMALAPDRGWLLARDHAGRTLDYDDDDEDEDLITLVGTYGRMQAATRDAGILRTLRSIETATLLDRLLAFLSPTAKSSSARDLDEVQGPVSADYFLGRELAAQYHRLLSRRSALLASFIEGVTALPTTLNHGDLRPPNAAITAAGDCVIFDWDDAIAGPAGLSLHGLFSGCTTPAILLSDSAVARAAAASGEGRRLHAYIDTLVAAGYAGRATLERHLPAAICCGMIQFILDFGRFAGEVGRSDVRHTMRRRLSSLLDLCDWLASRDRSVALELAEDYVAQGQGHRGQRLLQDQVARFPDDIAALARFSAICIECDDLDLAAEGYGEALERAPDGPELLAGLARVRMRQLQLDESEDRLLRALESRAACRRCTSPLKRPPPAPLQPRRSPWVRSCSTPMASSRSTTPSPSTWCIDSRPSSWRATSPTAMTPSTLTRFAWETSASC